MDTVYLFCESGFVRIPFIGYDPYLFELLKGKGGSWNSALREFVLTGKARADELNALLSEFIRIKVDKSSVIQLQIFGFFERIWDEPVPEPAPEPAPRLKSGGSIGDVPDFSMRSMLPLPEKFSESWKSALENELRSVKYSRQTIRTYIFFNRLLCQLLQKTPEEIRAEDIKKFLAMIEKDKMYCASSMNLAISALKFFYKRVLKSNLVDEQNRPNHDKNLPIVLAKSEVAKMLTSEKNPKHRLLLMLAYSSGLRVSEVVALKREHIDFARGVINVRHGKGRKDRMTILSEKAAAFITEYCDFYDIQTWLFPGQNPKNPLTIRSAQHIFDKAVRNAGIQKSVSIHSLRHAFATHLLEGGTDIRYIQSLLGHASLRTTSRYTHVARRSIMNIKSPLDTMS